MLHYEARTDTWYLDGHAVDPYEDFAAIRSADQRPVEARERPDEPTEGREPERDADAEMRCAIVREAIARVWSQDAMDHLIRSRLVALGAR
jgi:hypothetical protein